jgi:hypothetical protein
MPPALRLLLLTLVVLATLSAAGSEPFLIAERAWSAETVDVIGGGEDGFYAFGLGRATHARPDGTQVAAASNILYGFDRSVAVAEGVAVVVYGMAARATRWQ